MGGDRPASGAGHPSPGGPRWPPPPSRPGARSRSTGSACRRTCARSTRRTSRRSPARSSCRGCSSRSSCASDGDGFELVAGFHRIAAARSLGLAEVPVVVRDAETEDADRAVENITRKQLNPYEEAKAVRAMLDRGADRGRRRAGARLAQGARHGAREAARAARARPAADRRRRHPAVRRRPAARDRHGRAGAARRRRSPTSTTATRGPPSGSRASPAGCSTPRSPTPATARCSPPTCTAASAHEIAELRLGKKTEQLYAEAEKLHRQLDRYAYGPPPVRFSEQDVDQARAAGVLIEFEHGRPIIVDRPLYRELVKERDQAHPRRARGQGDRGGRGEEGRARGASGRPTR